MNLNTAGGTDGKLRRGNVNDKMSVAKVLCRIPKWRSWVEMRTERFLLVFLPCDTAVDSTLRYLGETTV